VVANGRPESDGGDTALGLFLNTLPMRLRLRGTSWIDLDARRVRGRAGNDAAPPFPAARDQTAAGGDDLFETAFNFTHFTCTAL
jgi:hypothetical protein